MFDLSVVSMVAIVDERGLLVRGDRR